MKTMDRYVMILMCAALMTFPVNATAGAGGGAQDAVAGVVGLRPVEAQSCVAIWVPIPEGSALSGFSWYNNDQATVFPEILLESGSPDNPVTLSEARVMAEDVQGVSSGWSQVDLVEPVACSSAGLYVLFRFPAGSEYTGDGTGGGAALGYRVDGQGFAGWISADGQEWVAFKGDFGFALQPRFVDVGDATVVMQGAQRGQQPSAGTEAVAYLSAGPNPFNPTTRLRFNLPQAGPVDLVLYNLRGEVVRTLVSESMLAGPHEVFWHGTDDNGQGVASGVYFARMRSGSLILTQRLALVR